ELAVGGKEGPGARYHRGRSYDRQHAQRLRGPRIRRRGRNPRRRRLQLHAKKSRHRRTGHEQDIHDAGATRGCVDGSGTGIDPGLSGRIEQNAVRHSVRKAASPCCPPAAQRVASYLVLALVVLSFSWARNDCVAAEGLAPAALIAESGSLTSGVYRGWWCSL